MLIVGEVALCAVLLTASGLMLKSFLGLQQTQPGFDPQGVLTFKLSMPPARYGTTTVVATFERELQRRLESLPGIFAASPATALPLELGPELPYEIAGRSGEDSRSDAQWRAVGPSYFSALGIPLRTGRQFNLRDTESGPPVAIINERIAGVRFRGRNPIGERITIGKGLGAAFEDRTRVIVGVAADVREVGLGRNTPEILYIPSTQTPDAIVRMIASFLPASWAVRTNGLPQGFLRAIRQEVRQADPQIALAEPRSLEDVVGRSVSHQRFNAWLLSVFSILALLLAVTGIYGVISYSVSARTREIGLRMALGAQSADTLRSVVGETLRLAGVGILIGLGGAIAASRALSGLLYGVTATDPAAYASTALILLAAACGAALSPALRAVRIDPIRALRYD